MAATTTDITITTGAARTTTTGVDGAIDVSFTIEIGEWSVEGACSLLPHENGRPSYGAWGDADHWLDGRTLGVLRARSVEMLDAIDAIEAACGPVALAFARSVD